MIQLGDDLGTDPVGYSGEEDDKATEDFYGHRPPPPEPTNALPGTREKILVMRRRDSQGYALWHPKDRKHDI